MTFCGWSFRAIPSSVAYFTKAASVAIAETKEQGSLAIINPLAKKFGCMIHSCQYIIAIIS
jgi:hypothetical protein